LRSIFAILSVQASRVRTRKECTKRYTYLRVEWVECELRAMSGFQWKKHVLPVTNFAVICPSVDGFFKQTASSPACCLCVVTRNAKAMPKRG